MKEEFVGYTQALALKELGFDEPCFGCYDEKGVFGLTVMSIKQYYTNSKEDTWNCAAPLYQQAFRWFREKHGLVGLVTTFNSKNNFRYAVYAEYIGTEDYKTYEEAEQACLDKLIEIVRDEDTTR